ncbi:putative Ion transport domain-containing protein [Helianthus debilis subsp. tardiflorus]
MFGQKDKFVRLDDLKVSEKKILDPQNKFLLTWNRFFVLSCILAVSIDLLFFYLLVFDKTKTYLGIDRKVAIIATTLRTVVDAFYLFHMALEFRTTYIAPSSRVFGRSELVIDPGQIANRYLRWYFIIDFLSVLPLPQRSTGSDVVATKEALLYIVLIQYIPRFAFDFNRTAGVLAQTLLIICCSTCLPVMTPKLWNGCFPRYHCGLRTRILIGLIGLTSSSSTCGLILTRQYARPQRRLQSSLLLNKFQSSKLIRLSLSILPYGRCLLLFKILTTGYMVKN